MVPANMSFFYMTYDSDAKWWNKPIHTRPGTVIIW